jgi:hypothetical protein
MNKHHEGDNNMKVRYKNYILESASTRSPKTQKWSIAITISNQSKQGAVNFQTFYASNLFDTQKEADIHSYNLGKEIIDGKHPTAKLTF